MRAAKMMCGQRKKPIAMKKGGNPVAKGLSSPALKPKVVKPKKGKGSYSRKGCLLYTSPSPRDGLLSRMPSSA